MFSEEVWLNYIIKLNNRRIDKVKSSGLTIWTLLGLSSILIYRLFDKFNIIFNSLDSLLSFLLWTSIFFDFAIIIFFLIISPISSSIKRERRFDSKFDKSVKEFVVIPMFITIAIFSYINIYLWFNSSLNLYIKWPFLFFGIMLSLQCLGFILIYGVIKYKISKAKKKNNTVNLPERKDIVLIKRETIITQFILGLLFLISVIMLLLNFDVQYYISNNSMIKTSVEFIILYSVLFYMYLQYVSIIIEEWGLNLEKRILIEGLNSDQIKAIFVREFLGEKTSDWINNFQHELKIKYDNYLDILTKSKKIVSETKGITDTQIINKNMVCLYELQLQLESSFGILESFINEIIQNLESFKKQGPLDDEEQIALDSILDDLSSNLKNILSEYHIFRSEFDVFCKDIKQLDIEKME